MARPQKPRVVTESAPSTYFKPQGIPMYELTEIVLTLDGVEALRLVDVDGHDQVEAARRMGVSRSTLSRHTRCAGASMRNRRSGPTS